MIRKSIFALAALLLLPIAAPAQSVSPYTQHTFVQTDVTNGWKWPPPGGTIGQQSTCIIVVDSLAANDVINVTGLSPHLSIVQPTLYTYGTQTAVTSLTATGGFYFSCAGLTQIKFAPTVVGSTIEVAASNGVIARLPPALSLSSAQAMLTPRNAFTLGESSNTAYADWGSGSNTTNMSGGTACVTPALSPDMNCAASTATTIGAGNNSPLTVTAPYSVELLAQVTGTTSASCGLLFGLVASTGTCLLPGSFAFSVPNPSQVLTFCAASTIQTYCVTGPVLNVGTTYLLDAIVGQNNSIALYVNGVLANAVATTGSFTTNSGGGSVFRAGSDYFNNASTRITATLQDVALYQSLALTPANIAAHNIARTSNLATPTQTIANLNVLNATISNLKLAAQPTFPSVFIDSNNPNVNYRNEGGYGNCGQDWSASHGFYMTIQCDFYVSGKENLNGCVIDYGQSAGSQITLGCAAGSSSRAIACASNAHTPCSALLTCTMTAQVNCAATQAVPTGSRCALTYDSSSTIAAASFLPIVIGVSANTLTATAQSAASVSGTAVMQALCI